jgi:HEAT repeat protein
MQLQQKLQELLDHLDTDPPRKYDELRALLSRHPMEFRTWAVAWICNGGRGPRAQRLLRLLHEKDLLRSLLVNPGAIPLRHAVRVAKLAQHSISNLDWIVAATIREGTVTQAARALQVLQHVPLTSRVVPGLAAALRNPNAKIRSLVSKLLGRLCANPAAIHALLLDSDARVRANMVEGFWGSNHPVALDVMRKCLRDTDNRVVANAALGLCRIGEPDGIEALRILSSHADHRHRISAVWGISQVAEPTLLPALEALAEDRIPKVREAARAALARLRKPANSSEPGLLITVSQAYRAPEGTLRLRAFVCDRDDNPMENLSAESFWIFQGKDKLARGEIRLPAQRDALITILWLLEESLAQRVRKKAHDAIVEAMRDRGTRDLHCLVGAGLHAALAFSADIGQLHGALSPANSNTNAVPDWSGLFRALMLAAPRSGCRAVVAFSGGSPLRESLDVDHLVQQAVKSEIGVHVVIFEMGPEIAPEWPRIASATQGSYRVIQDEDELQHAFWCVFSQLSGSYAITASGVSEGEAEFRLAVRSASGYGEASFKPLLRADTLPAASRRVK